MQNDKMIRNRFNPLMKVSDCRDCTHDGEIDKFWSSPIYITVSNISRVSYSEGIAPQIDFSSLETMIKTYKTKKTHTALSLDLSGRF